MFVIKATLGANIVNGAAAADDEKEESRKGHDEEKENYKTLEFVVAVSVYVEPFRTQNVHSFIFFRKSILSEYISHLRFFVMIFISPTFFSCS